MATDFLCLILIIADNYLPPFLTDFMLGFFWPYPQYFQAFIAWSMYVSLLFEPKARDIEELVQAGKTEVLVSSNPSAVT